MPNHSFWHVLTRSIVENDRISPRLLTTFAFTGAALALLWRGAMKSPEVINGIVISSWPPEYIWSGLLLLIAALLGLGKAVEGLVATSKIKADAAVATAIATGQAPGAAPSATTTTTTTLGNEA